LLKMYRLKVAVGILLKKQHLVFLSRALAQ